ncbi:MAG: LytTR family transcriptional regulator [Sphingobacteriales bacterium]|nr:MAG: LytTR family transcriptional regulator [Sphingobacteriales bacterium]
MKPFVNESVFEPMSIPFPKSVEKVADSVATQKLLIPFYDRKRTVSADEIVRLEGCGNYTNFFLKDGTKMLVSRTLKEYETLLTDASFVRVHKSCIVNLSFVRKFFIKKDIKILGRIYAVMVITFRTNVVVVFQFFDCYRGFAFRAFVPQPVRCFFLLLRGG